MIDIKICIVYNSVTPTKAEMRIKELGNNIKLLTQDKC